MDKEDRISNTSKTNESYISSLIISSLRGNCTKIIQKKSLCQPYVIFCLILLLNNIECNFSFTRTELKIQVATLTKHYAIIGQYFLLRKNWNTSNLGSALFKIEKNNYQMKNRTFEILVWRYWKYLKPRFVDSFYENNEGETEINCSATNCIFTDDVTRIDKVDLVFIHIWHPDSSYIRYQKTRNKKQIWVFFNDESPINAFRGSKPSFVDLSKVFNWSMTYRSDSEVPVPYGRTVPLPEPVFILHTHRNIATLIPNFKDKQSDILVAIMMSNCNVPFRNKFLSKLKRFIKVEIYGKCSVNFENRCPGHSLADCPLLNQYYFYLVMENSMCHQYISEKVFHNAYSKGAIPIIVGPSLYDCETLLPPNSYIHSENYESTKKLAEKILKIIRNSDEYFSFHIWRNHFEVSNEHGFFGSKAFHLCRMCEALNYNEEKQNVYTYYDLRQLFHPKLWCRNI